MTLGKQTNDELQGLSDQEMIDRLKWEDIPDTRKIQKERIIMRNYHSSIRSSSILR